MASEPIRIIIADDHPIFRAGLRMLLEAEEGFLVVGEARDGREAVHLAVTLRPDVALFDLAMPQMSGFDALQELSRQAASPRVILLTAAISREQTVEALQLGARGVVRKDAASQLLFRSIRAVMAGEYWVERERVTDLVQELRNDATRQSDVRRFSLTPRERQVVSAVAAGLTNRDIAAQLSVAEDTVKHHLSNVFDKVGVSNRLELALFAIEHGLVDRGGTA
jgi:DNA-binding NarL/FixJ family response regulator